MRLTRRTLTRRGLLLLALAGVGELAYLKEEGGTKTMQSILRHRPHFRPIAVRPSEVLDLSVWKINLPTNNRQVTQPALHRFDDDAFRVVEAVQFTAHCGGEPQPGSSYPRSELREMNANGSAASWSTTEGVHVMHLRQRITHLPVVKPQLICGQIHNEADYLIMVELDRKKLYVRYKNAVAGVLDDAYEMATYFELEVRASRGSVDVFYNGVHKVSQAMVEDGCYFKAGCYVQSSTNTGDLPTAYGQVEISHLQLRHE